nr:MAG TPA: hypothetical protein [Caudoviricetes sp.]
MFISLPYKKGLLNRANSPKYKREMRIYEICPRRAWYIKPTGININGGWLLPYGFTFYMSIKTMKVYNFDSFPFIIARNTLIFKTLETGL